MIFQITFKNQTVYCQDIKQLRHSLNLRMLIYLASKKQLFYLSLQFQILLLKLVFLFKFAFATIGLQTLTQKLGNKIEIKQFQHCLFWKMQTQQQLNLIYAASTISCTIQQILNLTHQNIKQKKLIESVPEFSHYDIMNIINMHIEQSAPNFGTLKPVKLQQEDVTHVNKIQKDSLSPKQLPSQHPEQNVNKLTDVFSQVASKKLSITNRSSFLKRKQSIISQIASVAGTQKKKNQTNQSFNKPANLKNQKSLSLKNDPLQNFTSLIVAQIEDPQIFHLRQKAEFKIKQKQRQTKAQAQRLKQDQCKIQTFKQNYGQNHGYTFDFQGQALGSSVQNDQKMQYYAMKYATNTLGKKLRTMYKNIDQLSKRKQQKVLGNKTNRARQSLNQTIDCLSSSQQIPLFQRDLKPSFIPQTDPSKLKILQYRKLYGKKFSRFDKNSMTIEFSSMTDKRAVQQDLFGSKRHFRDSLSISKSRSSSVVKDPIPRRLALPKLQGKYKVLDRYQQV